MWWGKIKSNLFGMNLRFCRNCLQIKMLSWPNVFLNSLDDRTALTDGWLLTEREFSLSVGCHRQEDPIGWCEMHHLKKDQLQKESSCQCSEWHATNCLRLSHAYVFSSWKSACCPLECLLSVRMEMLHICAVQIPQLLATWAHRALELWLVWGT